MKASSGDFSRILHKEGNSLQLFTFYAILQKVYFWNDKYAAAHATGYISDNRKGKVAACSSLIEI